MDSRLKLSRVHLLLLLAVMMTGVAMAPPALATEAGSLKLVVYGASGRVGSRVVDEALERGHRVTAVSRDLARIEREHENLSLAQGDVLDPQSVAALLAGQDVVVVAVRGSVDKSKDPAKTVHRLAAEVIVEALRAMGDGAPRLIIVGGAGSLEIEPGVLYGEKLSWFIPKSIRQEIEGHLLTLEYLRGVKDVRWTYLSPAKKFKPGKRRGSYRIGGDRMLLDDQGKSRISMEDYAMALIDEAEQARFIGKRFSVAY